jgi:modulator of FtsH protease HflC
MKIFNRLATILFIAYFVLSNIFFIVDEREHAVKFQFGEIIKSDYEPGLHFKLPFVNNVIKFEDRIMNYEQGGGLFLTGELKNLIVDYFITWRIADPAEFYRSVRGDETFAEQRLSAIIVEGIKAEFGNRTVQEVVSAERTELMSEMIINVRSVALDFGIDVIDVRVKRIELSPEVSDSVYSRMRQERNRVASQLRAEGSEESERIRSNADRQRTVIIAEANRDALELRGEGDARAVEIYANAYTQDEDFYAFYRSMQAYRSSIGGANDLLIISPESEFFEFFSEYISN